MRRLQESICLKKKISDVASVQQKKNSTKSIITFKNTRDTYNKKEVSIMCLFNFKKTMVVKQLDYSKPFIMLNFKTYKESTGDNAVKLAKIAEKAALKTGLNFIVCVQAIDLQAVASQVKIPVYAQHIDNAIIGKSTGAIVAENILDMNIHGSLLNHSEKRIDMKEMAKTVLKLRELDMKSIVCAKDHKEAKKIASLKIVRPDFIAVEPPELIGGETSVSQAKPEVIEKTVQECQGLSVIVGAGIKDNNDMKIALKYGAKGVLLASHFVLSKDPEKFLIELIKDI
jgi:triosephosphate isomerase